MQLDDENIQSSRPKVLESSYLSTGTNSTTALSLSSSSSLPSSSNSNNNLSLAPQTQSNFTNLNTSKNRSALTDINTRNGRRSFAPVPNHQHGLSSVNQTHSTSQSQSKQTTSISASTISSPFVSNTIEFPTTALQNVKSIKIKPDNRSFEDDKQVSSETTVVEDDSNNNKNNNKENEVNGEEEEEEEGDHFESVMSVVEKTVEEKQDESRRMSLKRQAPADSDSGDILEGDFTQELKKQRVESEYQWDDLDAADVGDPMMVVEYSDDIFEYLHELELVTLADPNYLHLQKNLRPKMRSILVDWMVEVHLKFRLLPETLYLSINIMDRFLSKEHVQVDRLQLLATGALFIAAKYEEVYSPSIKNYAYVTDGAFNENEIREAEKYILEVLKFSMSYPSPYNFLRRISKADGYDVNSRTVGKYLLEITIIDHRFIGYLPSLCAASAMYIARKMVGRTEWDGNLIHYSGGYREQDLTQISEMIMDYLVSPITHEEFFKKYASRKYFKVSILARQWAKKVVKEGKNIMDSEL